MKAKDKDGFVLYKSHFAPISTLSDEQLGRLFRAVYRWQIEGEAETEPDIAMAFGFLVNQFRIDKDKYLMRCEQNQENGKLGGRPKKTVWLSENQSVYEKAKKPDNEKDNENEKEKDNDKKNGSENTLDNWRHLSSAKLDHLRTSGQSVADFKRSLLLQEVNEAAAELGLSRTDIEAFMQKWGESSPGSEMIRAEYEPTFNTKERAKNYKGVGKPVSRETTVQELMARG